MSLGTGALVVFLLLSVGAVGVLYGRCWERKAAKKAAEEAHSPGSDVGKLGESLSKIPMSDMKGGRRSTLTMPKVDKKGKPSGAPPRPPSRAPKKAPPAKRPPTFRASDYAAEV